MKKVQIKTKIGQARSKFAVREWSVGERGKLELRFTLKCQLCPNYYELLKIFTKEGSLLDETGVKKKLEKATVELQQFRVKLAVAYSTMCLPGDYKTITHGTGHQEDEDHSFMS